MVQHIVGLYPGALYCHGCYTNCHYVFFVLVNDAASLYPSICLGYDICPTRYVRQHVPEEVAASQELGVVLTDYEISKGHIVKLAKPSDPNADKPVITKVLEKLLRERAAVRKVLKTEPDPSTRNILDARQKAKKVAANSTYGLLGATKGYLPLPDLAATITLCGRRALMLSKGVAENKYGAVTVAGDTVRTSCAL